MIDIQSLADLFSKSNIMLLIALFFIFNLCIVVVEAIHDRARCVSRNWKDSLSNVTIFIFTQLLERTFYGAIFFVALLPFYYWLSPIEIPMNAMTWLLALIIADFTYYWMHRVEHKYRLLWAHHSVHHSSQDYNLTIALRICVFESLLVWVFFVPMIIIGFNPFQTIVAFILVVQYQSWIHTTHIGELKWLEGILNTPSAHRVHHGSNKQYLDKNFGAVLMIWDRIFQTYEMERRKVEFGLTESIGTTNPIQINLFEYKRLWRDICAQQTLKKKLRLLFGQLGSTG